MKIFLFFVAVVLNFSPVFAKQYRFNIPEEKNDEVIELKKINRNKVGDFGLMEPVNLKNPEKVSLGLEAGGPKFTVYKNVQSVIITEENISVQPVVDVVKVSENSTMNISNDNKNVEENKNTSKNKLVEEAVVNKNIDEAKKLLNAAEKIANSVEKYEDKNSVKAEKKVMKRIEKPSLIIKFNKGEEDLKKSDEKKIVGMIKGIKENPDTTVKIISYYSDATERNLAFSRLLNTRKILLEKDVPTSQIMIMVLEDEEKSSPKADIIELFFVR